MSDQNTPIEQNQIPTEVTDPAMVEALPASDNEVAVEVSAEPESRAKGRDAAEAAFDRVLARSGKKQDSDVVENKTETPPTEDSSEETPVETEDAEKDSAPVNKGLDPSGRGPNSWKATVREKFRALPSDVQQEVLRRENEHQKLMAETTEVRRFANEFLAATQPYTAFLKANNVSPIYAYQDLMNTAYKLKTGDARTKAETIAEIIKYNSVDINILDEALAGVLKPVDPAQRELEELRARVKQQDETQSRAASTEINKTIEQFANDPANEFFNDVVPDMQVLLANGRASDLKDAYEKACMLNTEVRTVMEQRRTAPAPTAAPVVNAPNIQEKIAASSSVKGAPATTRPAAPKPKLTGRDAALAAWDALERKTRS